MLSGTRRFDGLDGRVVWHHSLLAGRVAFNHEGSERNRVVLLTVRPIAGGVRLASCQGDVTARGTTGLHNLNWEPNGALPVKQQPQDA